MLSTFTPVIIQYPNCYSPRFYFLIPISIYNVTKPLCGVRCAMKLEDYAKVTSSFLINYLHVCSATFFLQEAGRLCKIS